MGSQSMSLEIVYILEFKRSIDKGEGFLEVKEAEVYIFGHSSPVWRQQ